MGDPVGDGLTTSQVLVFLLYGGVLLAGLACWGWGGLRFRGRAAWWERRRRVLARRPVAAVDLLAILTLIGLLSILAGALIFARLPDGQDPNADLAVLLGAGTVHLPALVVVWLVARGRGGWRCLFGVRSGSGLRRQWRRGGVAFLAMMPVAVAALVLNAAVFHLAGWTMESQEVAELLLTGTSLPMRVCKWGVAILVAPLAEEVVFRGIALPLFLRVAPAPVGIVATSLVFAGIHGNAGVAVPLFAVGVCFATGYLGSGTLVVPVAMHMGFNAMNLTLMSVLP